MFNSKRYMTRGVNNTVHLETQLYLWFLIDALKSKQIELDYLQVFELSELKGLQQIKHSQEVPPYSNTYLIKSTENISAKIYVIDDNTHTTMLLAEEY